MYTEENNGTANGTMHAPIHYLPHSRAPPAKFVLIALLVSAGATFHYGLQLTIINPAEQTFLQFVNASIQQHYGVQLEKGKIEVIWSTTVASFFAGSLFGSLFINQVGDRFGRKFGIILVNLAICICATFKVIAFMLTSIELFAISRFLLGFCGTIGTGLNAVFLTECSPKYCRGAIGIFTGFFIQLGTITAAILAIPQLFGNSDWWWLIFALEIVAEMALLPILWIFLIETPNFLLLRGKIDEAKHSLVFYYGKAASKSKIVEKILEEIRVELKGSTDCLGMIEVWWDKRRTTRRGLHIAVVFGISMAFCGVALVDAYLVRVFKSAGFPVLTASIANVGIQIFGMLFGFSSILFVDRVGRRKLLLFSFCAVLLTNGCISLLIFVSQLEPAFLFKELLIASIAIFLFVFQFGFGNLFMLIPTELVSTDVRSATIGWCSVTHNLLRSIVLAIYLPLSGMIGEAEAFAIVVLPVLSSTTVYLFRSLPETKNRSLTELEADLESREKHNKKISTKL